MAGIADGPPIMEDIGIGAIIAPGGGKRDPINEPCGWVPIRPSSLRAQDMAASVVFFAIFPAHAGISGIASSWRANCFAWTPASKVGEGMGSANERRHYIATSSLIGWAHTHDDSREFRYNTIHSNTVHSTSRRTLLVQRTHNWRSMHTVGERKKVTAVTFFRCPTVMHIYVWCDNTWWRPITMPS